MGVEAEAEAEAEAPLKRIDTRLATKWHQLCSRICGYVKSRIAITLVQVTHKVIWGSRVSTHRISVQHPQRKGFTGLNLS